MENNKKETTGTVTRAEKKQSAKNLIKEVLSKKDYKHNDLIEDVAKLYIERFEQETDNINDVKGRIGSVLDIMKKEEEVKYEGGVYALNVKEAQIVQEDGPKQTRKRVKKEMPTKEEIKEAATPKKTTRGRKAKTEKVEETAKEEKEKVEPLPTAPLQPIAPTAPTTPETQPDVEKAPKKRGRKKAQATENEKEIEKQEETLVLEQKVEPKQEETKADTTALTEVKKGEVAQKATVMDMSFLFGAPKQVKAEEVKEKQEEKPVPQKQEEKESIKEPPKQERKEYPTKQNRPQQKEQAKTQSTRKIPLKKTVKVLTAEEKLKEAFLKKIRGLGGDYFEYYSVYLLEKYSRRNGRRLEGLRITAGDNDGGIDGEIEVTDKLGFRETIYIQSKNWNPEKGNERLWVVGETLLQQFIGACACRQAKDGKQHCRGIFITTSRFTPEAKRILEAMSDKVVGYDGDDLFETAKECEFGLIKKNGEWVLDEGLMSGEKAFFSML